MSFLIPAIPQIAGAIGGMFAGKASAPGGVDKSQANNLAANLLGNSSTTANYGNNLLGAGQQNLGQSANYFQTLLNGNRTANTQMLAPQIQQQQQQFQRALQTGANLDPRGGGRASTLFSLPSQQTSSLLGMFDQARPAAAQQLASIGTSQGALGNQAFGASNQGAGLGLVNQLGVSQQAGQNSAAIGNGIANIASGINWGKLFGQK